MSRHGYYLPALGTMHGDPEFAEESRALWVHHGQNPDNPGRYDGVSIWEAPDGTIVRRLMVQDYTVTEKIKVTITDVEPLPV
jgi:hypothetical protein